MELENPFKGPKPYENGDEFYGREKEIAELYDLIRCEPLTLLFSRSGTGKSSLINAGLIPFLKKELDFFPIYIHLNDAAVKESRASDLIEYVIMRCSDEIRKLEICGKPIKVQVPQIDYHHSLFEFIHNLRFTQRVEEESGGITEYEIKPLLIFDQLEEIFTHSFNKDELLSLFMDIRYLVENEMPEHLKERFKDTNDQYLVHLKNILKSKQKSYRILFSFREEFLPQFESFKKIIPSIKFTNSRLRLEPFSVDTAAYVIRETALDIDLKAAANISENLASYILGFEDERVDPFLLSLICYIIYDQLRLNTIHKAEEIKQMVESAIDHYLNTVYVSINDETKEFIEIRLITPDGVRNSVNYNEVTGDKMLLQCVNNLIYNPDLRLLSKAQFLDSEHISILHDRLIPPLFKRKQVRANEKEIELMNERRDQLEKVYSRNRRKLSVGFSIAIFLSLLVGSFALVLNANNSRLVSERREKELLNDSLRRNNVSLEKQAILLRENKRDLEGAINDKKNLVRTIIGQNDELKAKAVLLSDAITKVRSEKRKAEIALVTREAALNKNLRLYKELQISEKKLHDREEEKGRLAEFTKKQTDILIENLKRTDPFIAMAIAKYNYDEVRSIISDSIIKEGFRRTVLNSFNNSILFNKEILPFNITHQSKKNKLFAAVQDDSIQNSFQVYTLTNFSRPLVNLLNFKKNGKLAGRKEAHTLSESEFQARVLASGFTESEDFFYSLIRFNNRVFLKSWKLEHNTFKEMPEVRVGNFNSENSIHSQRNSIVIKGEETAKGLPVVFYDLNSAQIRETSVFYRKRSRKEEIQVYDVNNNFFVTSLDRKLFRFYKDNSLIGGVENYKSFGLIGRFGFSRGSIYFTASNYNKSSSFYINERGVVYDSVVAPIGFTVSTIMARSDVRIAYKSYEDVFTVLNREDNNWRSLFFYSFLFKKMYNLTEVPFSPVRAGTSLLSALQFSFSDNSNLIASVRNQNITVFDLSDPNAIAFDTLSLPGTGRYNSYFTNGDSVLQIIGLNYQYKWFFRKPKKFEKVEDVFDFLNSGYFGEAWPISYEEKVKYGIR
jgi:hypothetical protein